MDLKDVLAFSNSQTHSEYSNFIVVNSQMESDEKEGERQPAEEWPALQPSSPNNLIRTGGRSCNILSAAELDEACDDNPEVLATDSEFEGPKNRRSYRLPSDADEVISDSEGQANVTVIDKNASSSVDKTPVNPAEPLISCTHDSSSSFHTNSRQDLGSYNTAEMSTTQPSVRGHRLKVPEDPIFSQDIFGERDEDTDGMTSTPSEYIGTLHLSSKPMLVPDTVDEDVLPPSPDAYGSIPVIVPCSPTDSLPEENEKEHYNPTAASTLADSTGFSLVQEKENQSDSSSGRSGDMTVRRKTPPQDIASSEDLQHMLDKNTMKDDEESMGGESLNLHYTSTEKNSSDKQEKSQPSVQLVEDEVNEKTDDSIIVISFDEEAEAGDDVENVESQNLSLRLTPSQRRPSQHKTSSQQSKSHSQQKNVETTAEQSENPEDRNEEIKQDSNSSEPAAFHLSLPKDGTLLHPDVATSTPSMPRSSQRSPQGHDPSPILPAEDSASRPDVGVVSRSPSLTIHMIDLLPSMSQQPFVLEKPELKDTDIEVAADSRLDVFRKKSSPLTRSPSKRQILNEDSDDETFSRGSGNKRQREEPLSPKSSQQVQPQLKKSRTLSSDLTSAGYKASLESMDTAAPQSPVQHMEVDDDPEDVMMQETESYDHRGLISHSAEVDMSSNTNLTHNKLEIDINIHIPQTNQAPPGDNQDPTSTRSNSQKVVPVEVQSSLKESQEVKDTQKGNTDSNASLVKSYELQKDSRTAAKESQSSLRNTAVQTSGSTNRTPVFAGRRGKGVKRKTLSERNKLRTETDRVETYLASLPPPSEQTTVPPAEKSLATVEDATETCTDPYQFHGSQSQMVSPEERQEVVQPIPGSTVGASNKLHVTPTSTRKKWGKGTQKKPGPGARVSFDNPVTVSMTTPPTGNKAVGTTPQIVNTGPGPSITRQNTQAERQGQSSAPPDLADNTHDAPAGISSPLNRQSSSQEYQVTTKTVTKLLICEIIKREVTKSVINKDGKTIRTSFRTENDDPTVFKEIIQSEEEKTELVSRADLSPSPSRSASTLTSGDLGDVSSSLSRTSSGSRGSRLSLNSGSLETAIAPQQSDLRQAVAVEHCFTPPEAVVRSSSRRISDTHIKPGQGGGSSKEVTPGQSDQEMLSPHDQEISTIDKTGSDIPENRRSSESLFTNSMEENEQSADKQRTSFGESSEGIPCAQKTRDQESDHDSERQTRGKQRRSGSTGDSRSGEASPTISYKNKTQTAAVVRSPKKGSAIKSEPVQGARVMARWSDGYFYPGVINLITKSKYQVRFDDGDTLMLKVKDLLLLERLPIGQSVLVQTGGGYFDSGIITDHKKNKTSGFVYTVEKDDGNTSQFRCSQVILSEDQALTFITDPECHLAIPSSPQTPAAVKVADVSLDNLIEGKRRKDSRYEQLDLSVESEPVGMSAARRILTDPMPSTSNPIISSRGKRKKSIIEPSATSTPTPKGKHNTRLRGQKPSLVGNAEDSPVAPRRSPRKSKMGLFEPTKGPLGSKKALFRGMAFLLSHVDKTDEQKASEKRLLQESSLDVSTDEGSAEVEPEPPFDKEHLKVQIETGGGVVLDKYNSSQVAAARQCFLVSDTYHRTIKFFQCLASAIPCVSHMWISDSCSQGKLLDYKSYILQAGISHERRKVMEWNFRCGCLKGLVTMVVSQKDRFQDEWSNIMKIAQCKVVTKFPGQGAAEDVVNVVITDNSCPASVLRRAKQLDVPIVSTEWVIQCLINGKRLSYDGHPRYKYDYMDI